MISIVLSLTECHLNKPIKGSRTQSQYGILQTNRSRKFYKRAISAQTKHTGSDISVVGAHSFADLAGVYADWR